MSLDPIKYEGRKQDIILPLPRCKVFYFASYGYIDMNDPSKSHLLFECGKDDSLTVANLLEMNTRQSSPFLAYLSACGTGQIADERFFDESIHLISSFQLAGSRHVIDTLWKVNDELCTDMAKIACKGMKDGGMADDFVCRGLHSATGKLRDRWLDMLIEPKRERKPVKQTDEPLMTTAQNINTKNRKDERLPRDASMIDEDDEESGALHSVPLHWVLYVHFSV